MNTNEEKMIRLIGSDRCVSLSEILDNLKVLKVETDDLMVRYFLTRTDNLLPWPAPYQAGQKIDGKPYHCCSYISLDDDNYPEDTKELNVYRIDMEE